MIPADLAARLRLLNEASFFNADQPVAGLQRAREIQADLPDLVPGQRVLATLQQALPDGTFRALIAGRQMTLALDASASAGDTLDLVVTETTPRTVFARLATPDAAAGNASALPSLSRTGRLISFLLTGQPASAPAALSAGRPVLDAPPASGAQLAPALREAIGRSGLFYESHQAQWAQGRLDVAALQREPHNLAAAGGERPGSGLPAAAADAARSAAAQGRASERNAPPDDTAASPRARPAADESPMPRGLAIPERLLPVVHQQLDALATHQYVWQGQAWPGQAVEWIIHDPENEAPEREQAEAGEEPAPEWKTTLRLTLPRLGGVEAELHLTAAGVALRMRADDPAAIAALQERRAELQSALDAAALPLTGMVVEPR
ncbi:flagellar hook-length control protein FliK [Thauera sinica]|uniref:Flagellar hook-length control protein FliK n=1 Tax=Thauera sinica TaxID=2665146 RepID=A0ABW1APH4_9RHOO|nr:flagellar hook-length control protein FliK [Thauera sp. K11]ATE59433.1 flagellar hook-length control protein FliK [Thauera sp. K11]